jgi:COP9 signalosome complex subunit 4
MLFLQGSAISDECVMVWILVQGSIDQVDGLLHFETDMEGLKQWDEQIASVCNQLNNILDSAADRGLPVFA